MNGKKVSYPFMPKEGVLVSYINEAVVIEKVSIMRLTYYGTGEVVLSVSTVLTDQFVVPVATLMESLQMI